MTNAKNILKWPRGTLDFSQEPLIMGILNVTPDSFSDGGLFWDTEKAVEHGLQMAQDGAAIIDIGGESTRPGSDPVDPKEEINRVIPVIKELSNRINVPISIDTCHYEVAKAAINAGAAILNDITALSDEQMASLIAVHKIPVILMHMQGIPSTMQSEPHYNDVVKEVLDFLLARAKKAQSLGISKDHIFIDPGIGFGKTTQHNLSILKNIERFTSSGYRVLIGASRKNFIGQITGKKNPAARVFGTAATVALCARAGVSIVRVHDVAEMADVVKVTKSLTPDREQA